MLNQAMQKRPRGWAGQVLWVRFTGAVVVTTIASLSVHVIMLDVLRVPHPDNSGVARSALFLSLALSVVATTAFYCLARSTFEQWPLLTRCLLLATLSAMLSETLLRNFIMDGVVSHAWAYCLVENMPKPIEILIACSLIVLLAPRLRLVWQLAAGAIILAAAVTFLIRPLVNGVFDKLVASLEYLDTGNIYNPPYGWQVNVPSYLTFAEPVLASFAIAALVWDKLSPRPAVRLMQFILLIMAMKGSILPTLVYSFYQRGRLPAAFLSESQFGLEVLVMAFLTAYGWQWSRIRRIQTCS